MFYICSANKVGCRWVALAVGCKIRWYRYRSKSKCDRTVASLVGEVVSIVIGRIACGIQQSHNGTVMVWHEFSSYEQVCM